MKKIIVYSVFFLAQAYSQISSAESCDELESPPLPSRFEYAIDYQKQLYTWINCFRYKKTKGVAVDKTVRQTGPFIDQKDYGVHPAVRIWYSSEVVKWLKKGRPNVDGHALPKDLPDGSFLIKEMFMSPANIYNELVATPPFKNDKSGEAYEAMLEALIGSWTIMIKDRNGPSADGWYWAQTEPNPNTTYQNPPNYNPTWLDNYTSTELDVYNTMDGEGLKMPKPHFIYSGFSTGTCIRCHASSSSESTFATLNNIDTDKNGLQFRVDNSWRSKDYLDSDNSKPSLVDKIKGFNTTFKSMGENIAINGEALFNDYLKPIWFLPPSQRPFVHNEHKEEVAIRDAHLPAIDAQEDELTKKSHSIELAQPKNKTINKDFVAAFSELKQMKQPSVLEIEHFSFPPAFADHSFSMKMKSGQKPDDHPTGPMTPELQQYITSDNCVGCHGGLGGAPSGVSQFIQTGPNYGDGLNISPYGEWRWSPMGLAGRDPIFHAQIETELLILLKENGLLKPSPELADTNKLNEVRQTQQALVDTCLRCHGAMGLRQKGLDQSNETIRKNPSNHSKSKDPIQTLLTQKDRKILNPKFDLNNFYRTVPPSSETKPFKPWADQVMPSPPIGEFSNELGNLAREGISCTVCHHITPPDDDDINTFINTAKAKHPEWIKDDGQIWSDAFFTFLATNNSGLYQRSEKDQILGPFDDVRTKPMQHGLGITPSVAPTFSLGTIDNNSKSKFAEVKPFTSDSAMCGTCHTINLPNIGESLVNEKNPILRLLEPNPVFQDIPHSIEQATYLEWLNSDFGPGLHNRKGPEFQSCQDCHMPNQAPPIVQGEKGASSLAAQIATIQDANYPYAEHQLPSADINVPIRPDYQRHELVGLNGFILKMFQQNPNVLNVNKQDIETFTNNGAEFALDNMVRSTTENRVATIDVSEPQLDQTGDNLVVGVSVKNNTGHRFPSGVAFRRAWIELLVKDSNQNVLWASGKSNNAGIITGKNGQRLDTEFLKDPNRYQKHYQEICSEDHVQIYEELVKNAQGKFTTSFVHRVDHIKDNRLLPRGWVPGDVFAGSSANIDGLKDQGELLRQMMRATDPDGVGRDPDFNESPGGDSLRYRIPITAIANASNIEVTLYSQAVTPAWLWNRFSMANDAKQVGFNTPATDRLYYIASNLDLSDSPLNGWKFKITAASVKIPETKATSDTPAQCNKPWPEKVY